MQNGPLVILDFILSAAIVQLFLENIFALQYPRDGRAFLIPLSRVPEIQEHGHAECNYKKQEHEYSAQYLVYPATFHEISRKIDFLWDSVYCKSSIDVQLFIYLEASFSSLFRPHSCGFAVPFYLLTSQKQVGRAGKIKPKKRQKHEAKREII